MEWPSEWQQPDQAKCAELRNGPAKREVEFVEFVQWTADSQLHAAKELASRLGMRVGLYLDVAVGVQSNGFDAWNEQTAISRHLAVGAPPDVLNTIGQDWGLAGFNAGGSRRSRSCRSRTCSRRRCAMPAPSGSITCSA